MPSLPRLFRLASLLLLCLAVPSLARGPSIDIGSKRGEIDRAAYFKPGLAPVRNIGAYDVTIVYFMDYQCPACRKYTPDVSRALADEPKVRVIYRDTPIFGPRSERAARVAIASQFQGKHEAMHRALMQSDMPLDEEAIRLAAAKAGVDWARLQRDLETHRDDIDLQIAWNGELAQSAGIAGTPAFIIGNVLAAGTLDYKGLRAEIADARRKLPASTGQEVSPEAADDAAAPAPEEAEADPADRPEAASVEDKPMFRPSAVAEPGEGGERGGSWTIAAAIASLAALVGLTAFLMRRARSKG